MSIELKNVSYTYAPGTVYAVNALKNISLKLNDGEFVGVIGRTGCGKSTLIQLIAGLIKPAAGQVLIDDCDINDTCCDKAFLRQKIGVIFQYPECQLFEATVEKDVAFGMRHFGWSRAKVQEAVKEALEIVGLNYDEVKDLSPLSFSGGQKRRIAIAGILAVKPDILILDEPIAGLDPLGREAFLKLITKLNRTGVTIIMISHNADVLAEYADRILVLKNGELINDGLVKEVFSDYGWLKENGLGAGQVREITELLRGCGYEVPKDTIRYPELLEYMKKIGRGDK